MNVVTSGLLKLISSYINMWLHILIWKDAAELFHLNSLEFAEFKSLHFDWKIWLL